MEATVRQVPWPPEEAQLAATGPAPDESVLDVLKACILYIATLLLAVPAVDASACCGQSEKKGMGDVTSDVRYCTGSGPP